MGRPSKNYSERELKQARNFTCIIYPDSEEYDCQTVLNRLSSFWDKFYYVLHDKDSYSETDVDKWIFENNSHDCPFGVGELKKPHYHIVTAQHDPILLGRAATKFGICSNYVQICKSLKLSVQYLIHQNNDEKFHYDPSDIITNDDNISSLLCREMGSMDKAKLIISFINGCENVTLSKVADYCLQEGLWDELRRGQHIFTTLISESRGAV